MTFRADRRAQLLRVMTALALAGAALTYLLLPAWHWLIGLLIGVALALVVGERQLGRADVALRESALRTLRSEQRLRLIFDAFPHPVVVSAIDDGRYLELNPKACERLGMPREQLIGRLPSDVGVSLPEDQRQAAVRRLYAEGRIDGVETPVRTPDGRSHWSLYSARLIEIDGVQAAIAVTTDVTALKKVQEDLRRSEQSFEALFESAPVPMSYSPVGEDGLPEGSFWNQAWYDSFGYAWEQAQGKRSPSFGFWPDEAQRQAFVRAAGLGAGVQTVEAKLRRADGAMRTAMVSGRLIERLGQPQLLTSYQDVTQVREDAQRLGELARMVESAQDGMLMVEAGIIIECNEAASSIYGRTREQLIGSRPDRLSPPRQDDGRDSTLLAQDYLVEALRGRVQRFVWRHLRGDGSSFLAEVVLNAVQQRAGSDESRSRRVIAVVRDVTEARRAAAALASSEQRFRQLFERSPVALALTALDGRILALNQGWTALLGYTQDDMQDLEQWWQHAYPDPDYARFARDRWGREVDRLVRSGGEPQAAEFEVCCKNGERRLLLIGLASIGDELLASFHDVTEERRAKAELQSLNLGLEERVEERTRELRQAIEDLKQTQAELVRSEKLAGLGALVAGVSHELNTPIGNAVMVASTQQERLARLEQDSANGLRRSQLVTFLAEAKESAAVVARNLQRAAELVNSFKQVAVDQSSYQRREFRLSEVVHELGLMLSPTLRRSDVCLCEDVDETLVMDSYPGPLTQVLMNLVNNAVTHGLQDADVERLVLVRARALKDETLCIEVEDKGRGIAAEHLPRVFDPFFTTRLGQGGSGLGMHIVYSLVTELLGGSVRIVSEPGRGTLVRIELPRRAPQGGNGRKERA